MVVRDATEADLPAILAITNDAVASTTALWTLTPLTLAQRRAWFEERRAAGFPVLVAEGEAGAVAGFGSYGGFRAFEGYAATVEHSVYVDAAHRGRGAGRALVVALIERARAAGLHAMVGGIEAGNEASLRLHDALGFIRAGVLPQVGRKFGRWLDLAFVVKVLGEGGAA
jgi:phosphinothricin acetyltransferase